MTLGKGQTSTAHKAMLHCACLEYGQEHLRLFRQQVVAFLSDQGGYQYKTVTKVSGTLVETMLDGCAGSNHVTGEHAEQLERWVSGVRSWQSQWSTSASEGGCSPSRPDDRDRGRPVQRSRAVCPLQNRRAKAQVTGMASSAAVGLSIARLDAG